ncbi:MAG: single-stranded DNA-binding protein [Clostridiales bacterium]|jgi:single-stranded DNA-binding protein|nr:single-stranded DNA-binding protein [Clostridiales bacterium]
MSQALINKLILRGVIAGEIKYSHESHGVKFCTFTLKTQRLSGAYDYINVLAGNDACKHLSLSRPVEVEGEIRSFNQRTSDGTRLVISAYAKNLYEAEPGDKNAVFLSGAVCKKPVFRKTPLGREICDIMLAVNRRYGRADYIPCIIWGKNAHLASGLDVGSKIGVSGRIQSRNYIKKINDIEETRTTYEVSVSSFEYPEDKKTSGIKPSNT